MVISCGIEARRRRNQIHYQALSAVRGGPRAPVQRGTCRGGSSSHPRLAIAARYADVMGGLRAPHPGGKMLTVPPVYFAQAKYTQTQSTSRETAEPFADVARPVCHWMINAQVTSLCWRSLLPSGGCGAVGWRRPSDAAPHRGPTRYSLRTGDAHLVARIEN